MYDVPRIMSGRRAGTRVLTGKQMLGGQMPLLLRGNSVRPFDSAHQ